jgi:two-component system, NtrC family, sensor kinase
MRRLLSRITALPLQVLLVASFSLVAAVTIGLGAFATSRVISDYLTDATSERVARDMQLAQAFYDIKLREISAISYRLALDPLITDSLPQAGRGDLQAQSVIDRQIANKVTVLALGGSHFIAVLNPQGQVLAGRLVAANGEQSPVVGNGNWSELPIVKRALATQQQLAATEVIPAEILALVGLAGRAHIDLVDTPKASSTPFDPREGTAGLALVGVSPILGKDNQVTGLAVALHLFNNDSNLVDQIRDVAGIDSVTIFFGDLRVSTNVLTQDGRRAVGTRLSREVSQVLLDQGRQYTGPAFVVNEDYVTRYEPLRDHTGQVVGSLYVGVRLASFNRLVSTFTQRVVLIALATIFLAVLLAIPFSRSINRPIQRLVSASQRVSRGDMAVRVPTQGPYELAQLETSFNSMIEAVYANQKAEQEKLTSLGQLAAGVAHEINNPLGTILLYCDLLLQQPAQSDQSQADLTVIISEAKRCKAIVTALLNFSRQTQIMPQPTDLNQIVASVLEVEQRRPENDRLRMVTGLDPALPLVPADPLQLREVLINLVANAEYAMPGKGQLTVGTRCMGQDAVILEVQDTGVGIAPENLSKLFTPFFTTKPFGKGTGLGLAIAYGIVKMHNGQIGVQSQPGKGTTITVTLPTQRADGPAANGIEPFQGLARARREDWETNDE